MRSRTLLCAALWATSSVARLYHRGDLNSTAASTVLSTPNSTHETTASQASTILASSFSPTTTTVVSPTHQESSPSPTSTLFASSTPSHNASTVVTTPTTFDGGPNSTITHTNGSTTGACTGCVLEAYRPVTTFYNSTELSWSTVTVTETILTKTISYFTGTPETLETTVIEYETIKETKTIIDSSNETVTHTAPFFTITPTAGVEVTVPVGPIYVIYQSIYGGLDHGPTETDLPTSPTPSGIFEPTPISCTPQVEYLPQLTPAAEDWSFYIQTIGKGTGPAPPSPVTDDKPYKLPPGLVDFLKQDPDAQAIFSGSDLATCTLAPTIEPPALTSTEVASTTVGEFPPETGPVSSTVAPTSTWLSTVYQSTSTQISVRGCLRCDTGPAPIPPGPTNEVTHDPNPTKNGNPNNPPTNLPNNPPATKKPNPFDPALPQETGNVKAPNDQGRVTIGTDVYILEPARPTQGNPSQPNPPNPNQPAGQNKPTGVVIGTNTLTFGQTTTWNGVPVVVPSSGGGSTILVGGSSVAVNPAATAPPVLTIGDQTVTANPQGQFVFGTQTLAPGQPAVTIDGTTLQLGPSGTIAIVNGQTQSLGHAPFPTNGPAITIDGQIFSASVIGGTTVFAIGSQTLTPGGVLTQDGTTFSLPANGGGSTVVVNGVTSTLGAPGLPVLTIGSEGSQSTITASVQGGTTAFVLAPGQTLMPGGVLTISGTTYSLPASASGSVVVINGQTSTLGQGPITAAAALTIDGKTYSATVRDGTTEFVIGDGQTLKPGESIVVSGTTYSLDPSGTALVIDGKTSTIPKTPASNSASTTKSSSSAKSSSTSGSSSSSSSSSSSTTTRDPGDFIASGLDITQSRGGGGTARGGLDKLIEGAVIGFAGWLVMLM